MHYLNTCNAACDYDPTPRIQVSYLIRYAVYSTLYIVYAYIAHLIYKVYTPVHIVYNVHTVMHIYIYIYIYIYTTVKHAIEL